MRQRRFNICGAAFALVATWCVGQATAQDPTLSSRIVDLTHTYDTDTIFWPTEKGFRLERGPAGVTEKGYYYSANRLWTPEHGGTHVDAPSHFFADRPTVDQIPLKRLIGSGVVVDVRDKCRADRDYQIAVEDLQAWEAAHGDTLDGKIILLNTGYATHWPDREKYLGTAETGRGAIAKLHFPGLDPTAARWLARRRKIKAIGLDTASIDYGQSTMFGSHVTLCEHRIPILENVASMDALPATGFTLIALPMKIAGGSGGPTRVVALLATAPDGGW